VFTLPAAEEIKPGLNFLKSAIVPGWGQLSLDKGYGYVFLIAEISFWTMRLYYNQESENKADASFKYAIKYGELDPKNNYSRQFFEDMRRYISSGYGDGGYNAGVVREAAKLFPDDLEAQLNYIEDNIYDEDHYWSWQSDDHKKKYSIYRKNMDQYTDYLKLVAGALAANHIIGAIDALRLSNYLKNLELGVNMSKDDLSLLTLTYRFR